MGFYGEPSMERETIMETLNAARRRPWLSMGDFNKFLLGGEMEGAAKGSGVLGPIPVNFGGL